MRFPCHWMKYYLVWTRQNEGSEPLCSTQLQLFQSRSNCTTKSFSFFPFPLNKALIMEVSMRKNRPIPWAAARSNLVGKPTSSWHVTVARGGEAKTYLPNFRYAIRSRKRLVQSNSTLNTLSPSGSPSVVLATRGYVQWTFSLWICLNWCKIQSWPL